MDDTIYSRESLQGIIDQQLHFIHSVTSTVPALITITDHLTGEVTFSNHDAMTLLGFEASEVRTMGHAGKLKLLHTADVQRLRDYHARFDTLKDEEDNRVEYRIRNKRGDFIWLDVRGRVFRRDDQDKVTATLHIEQDITARKEAELEILLMKEEIAQLAADKYYTLLNTIDEGFCIFEMLYNENGTAMDFRIMEVNEAFQRQTGLKEAVGKTGRELSYTTEPYWLDMYDRVLRTGESARFENYHEGTGRWYHVFASRVGNTGSRLMATVFDDITERKRTEERQAFLLNLGEALHPLTDAIEIQHTAARVIGEHLHADRAFYTEFSPGGREYHTVDNYANAGSHIRIGQCLTSTFSGMIRRFSRGETPVIADMQHTPLLTGSEKQAYLAAGIHAIVGVPLIKGGRLVSLLAVKQNTPREWRSDEVSLVQETAERTWAAVERAKAEAKLRDREALLNGQKVAFQAAMSGQPLTASLEALVRTAIAQFEGEARAAFYIMPPNKEGLYLMAGMSSDYAHDVNGFAVGPESLACGLAMHTGEPVITPDTETDLRWEPWRKLARDHHYRGCWSFPVRTDGGPVLGTFALYFKEPREPRPKELQLAGVIAHAASIIMSRYTQQEERAKAEAALRESDQQLRLLLRQKDEFIGVASHELKTPVTSIKAYAQIVQMRLEELGDKGDSDLLARLNAQIDRLTILINHLLDTTRISEGQLQLNLESIDINKVLQDRVDEIGRTTNHRFEWHTAELPPVIADLERISQVITNLLSNAIKYSPKGTTITISTRAQQYGIEASVRDEGYGIPENALGKVFDRFFRVTANYMNTFPGMGLGLYITSQIIQKHGGTISVESQENKGSCFTFTLPYQH